MCGKYGGSVYQKSGWLDCRRAICAWNGGGETCGFGNADFKPNMSGTPFPIPLKTIMQPTADQESEELEIEICI